MMEALAKLIERIAESFSNSPAEMTKLDHTCLTVAVISISVTLWFHLAAITRLQRDVDELEQRIRDLERCQRP